MADKLYNELLSIVESEVGDQITDSRALDDYGFSRIPGYVGTFPRTRGLEALKQLKRWQCMIINTTDAPGEHWCALYKFHKTLLFYDSFGRSFAELFARRAPRELINTEDDAEQAEVEYNCGARALAWILVCIHGGEKMAEKI